LSDISVLGLREHYERVKSNVILTGYIDKVSIAEKYAETDLLMFPSLIETMGLPLVEAAALGLPILSLKEKYSEEALLGYDNVEFLGTQDPSLWAMKCRAILTSKPKKGTFRNTSFREVDPWGKILDLVKQTINNY